MLDHKKRPSITRSASTPAREAAREKVRRLNHNVLDRGAERWARIEAERDAQERMRWALQAIRG